MLQYLFFLTSSIDIQRGRKGEREIERERQRQRKRQTETLICCFTYLYTHWLFLYGPWLGIRPTTLVYPDAAPTHYSTQPWPTVYFYSGFSSHLNLRENWGRGKERRGGGVGRENREKASWRYQYAEDWEKQTYINFPHSEQGCQTHFHQEPRQPRSCHQRAEYNFTTV